MYKKIPLLIFYAIPHTCCEVFPEVLYLNSKHTF